MLVLCCGMIRSGSTLQYNLARSLVEAAGRGEAGGFTTEGEHPDRARLEAIGADQRMHVVKTHHLLGLDRDPLPRGHFALCYSYRDFRDVAGSAKTHWDIHGDELYQWLAESLEIYERVAQMDACLTQSYELLTGDTNTAARQISDHLGLGLAEQRVSEVAQQWSREKVEQSGVTRPSLSARMVRKARNAARSTPLGAPGRALWHALPKGLRHTLEPLHRDASLLHPGHISEFTKKGVPSREALTAEEHERVMELAGPWLEARGYV